MVIVYCRIARCVMFGVPRLPVRPCDERPPAMYGHFCLVHRVSVHDRYYCIPMCINLLFLISIAFLKQWRQRYSHAQEIALYGYLSRKVLTLPFFCPDLVGPTEVICACRKLRFSPSAIWMSYLCRPQHIICTPSKEKC